MKRLATLALACGLLIGIDQSRSQDRPAQPPEEENIGKRFEEASPDLFKEWSRTRSEDPRRAGRGTQADQGSTCTHAYWFEFIECTDTTPPKLVGLDARKTDSLLSPFVGTQGKDPL